MPRPYTDPGPGPSPQDLTPGPTAPIAQVTTPKTLADASNVLGPTALTDPGQPVALDPNMVRKNTKVTYTELPLQSYVMWDAMTLVQQALADHENGLFRSSSLLADAFGRDDRIASVRATRCNTVFSCPLSFEPTKKKQDKSKRIADDLADVWPKMFPQAEKRKLLQWGRELGVGLGELVWDKWMPTMRVWHPQYLYWDWGTYQFWVATTKGLTPVIPGNGKWVLYTPYGFKYGWMQGLVRAVAEKWFYRKFDYRDWARYNEVHGLPIRKAIVPADADDKHQDRFVREMSALGTETVLRLPQGPKDTGANYDLQLLEATADTYNGFVAFMNQLDNSLAIAYLGQNMTTSTQGPGGASYASAKVQQGVRDDLKQDDAESMSECLKNQALVHYVRFNYDFDNAEDITPTPTWQVKPPEDKNNLATAYQALGAAISAFRAEGATLDWRKIFIDFGLPVVGMGIDPASTSPQLQQQQDQGDDGSDGPPQKKKPGAKDPVKNALDALAALKNVPGYERGQKYADEVMATALQQGARVIGKDVATILTVVRRAGSPDELKRMLLSVFSNMDPSDLAKVEQKARILAKLDGKNSVLEDL